MVSAQLVPRPLLATDLGTHDAALRAAIRLGLRCAITARLGGTGPPVHWAQIEAMVFLLAERPEPEALALVAAYEGAAGSAFDLLTVGLLRVGALRREASKP